ncbi:MAG: nitrilase-related carbon-nitrogen hydrolase [Armatimonadota bacterium]
MGRIAVIQVGAPWDGPKSVRGRTFHFLEEAAARGATLAVLPELCTISYDFRTHEDVAPYAESLDGPSLTGWSQIARETGMHIVAGFPERSGSQVYNSAAVIGPNGRIGTYRKAHLYHFERNVFTPGDLGFPVWDTPVGRLGVLICYDLRFAEAVRILLLRGAEILCVPTTWTDRGKPEPWDSRGWCGANYLAAGHAYGNRLWVACANRAGQDGAVRTLGCSAVFASTGMAVAGPASHDRDEVVVANVDPSKSDAGRASAESDLIKDRRPDLYGDLVRPQASSDGQAIR